jgi:hypothetical protein
MVIYVADKSTLIALYEKTIYISHRLYMVNSYETGGIFVYDKGKLKTLSLPVRH